MTDMHSRLIDARLAAGFKSKKSAYEKFGWGSSTYAAHENGQNKYDDEWAKIYGKAYNISPEWLLFGTTGAPAPVKPGGIDEQLRQLPENQSKKLIERFNAMIEGVRLAGKID